MQLTASFPRFNVAAALQKSKLLPILTSLNYCAVTCSNCCFVNLKDYNFCTNCGYPVCPDKDRLALYYCRMEKRKSIKRNCLVRIERARNALYVLGACSMLGIFYFFSEAKQTVITGFVMVLLGLIYAGLGRWSLRKPFTALLISLIIMLTFTLINTWAELSSMFTAAGSIYMLMIQMILIYFLLQGVKGAFRADVLEEEFKV